MHQQHLALLIHRERQLEAERRIALNRSSAPRRRGDSVRKRIGHRLIRIGSAMAADGPLQQAASGR